MINSSSLNKQGGRRYVQSRSASASGQLAGLGEGTPLITVVVATGFNQLATCSFVVIRRRKRVPEPSDVTSWEESL